MQSPCQTCCSLSMLCTLQMLVGRSVSILIEVHAGKLARVRHDCVQSWLCCLTLLLNPLLYIVCHRHVGLISVNGCPLLVVQHMLIDLLETQYTRARDTPLHLLH